MALKKYKVKRKFKEDIEPEEIFMDSKRLKESPDSEREKLEKPIKEIILKVFLVLIIILLASLLFKSFQLQIIKGSYWRGLADENRIRSYPIKPLRGIIFDRNQTPLAINVPKLDLVVIPADLARLDNFDEIVGKLAQSLERPKEAIETKINENISLSYPVVIKEDIERERAILLESEFAEVSSVNIRKDNWRQYKDGSVFSHILGYLGKVNPDELSKGNYFVDDYIGRTGLEKIYEDSLRGIYGKQLTEVDNLGITQEILATKEPIAGNDLILSIDADLQKKLYQVLKARLNTLYTSRGAGIAINPQNGKILALVSLPGFNNNDFIKRLSPDLFEKIIQDKNEPLFNRVIAGEYPPGSTIKPLIASAVLEEGIVNPNKQIHCPGHLSLPDKYNPNIFWTFYDWKTHGIVNIYKAIAESCNVYFYTVAGGYKDIEGLGIERIERYLKFFGWGRNLGIDLPGEKSGFIPNSSWKQKTKDEEWYIGDTYNVSIGQGHITVTPLQLTMAIAVIANGGRLFQPQLLNNKKPRILNQNFIKEEFLEAVRKGMREAVISGSARSLADLPVKVAGKTGTAQVSKTKAPHSWFTVFGPYEGAEIVLTILIENGGEGSATAAPVAKEVLAWYFDQRH
jgi:penicillin-binding protein 2